MLKQPEDAIVEDIEREGSGFDHPVLQILFFAIIFWIPFYRWRHISPNHEFLKVDWLLVLGLLAIIGPYVLVRRRLPRRLSSNLNTLFILFFLVNCVSSLLSPFPAEVMLGGMKKLIFGYVLIAMTLLFMGPRGYQRTLPVVLCTAVTMGALLGIFGYIFQVDMLTVGVTTGEESAKRAAGGSIGANNSALLYIFTLPLLVHWLHYGRSSLSRGWAMVQIVILLLGIVSTYSRGGFLMFMIVVGLILFEERRRFHPRLLGPVMALACAALIMAIVAVPDSFVDRIRTLAQGTEADAAMSRRAAYLVVGWNVFTQHPLIGTGTDTFTENWFASEIARRYEHERRYAHNTYMEVLVGSGILGLLLFLGIIFRAWSNFRRAERHHRQRDEEKLASLAAMYRISYMAIVGYLLILSSIEHKLFLLSLAASQVAVRMAYSQRQESTEAPGCYEICEREWLRTEPLAEELASSAGPSPRDRVLVGIQTPRGGPQ